MSERRNTARKKSFLRGSILFNNRRSAVDCLIRDFSEHGAKLVFADTGVPDVIDLYIPHKDQTLRAHVQWRHGDEAGVTFHAPGPAAARQAKRTDLEERVEQLEAEVASLKRMLKQLKIRVAAGSEPETA
jgi:hypothetical protein